MIKKLAYWIGENKELNILCREYIREYSKFPDWDVILFSENNYKEQLPKFPAYTMYDYDGLIVVDSIEKLSKTEELFGAKSLLYIWEDNWGAPTDFLNKVKLLSKATLITRNNIEGDKFKSVWGLSPMANILYPEPKEIFNATV